MDYDAAQSKNFNWDFKIEPAKVMEYIAQVLSWIRLCMLEDPDGEFSGAEYYAKHVLLYDVLPENWAAEATIGFIGQDFFDVLNTRLDTPPESPEYQKAYRTIWRLLTRSSMQKVTHAKNLTNDLSLGILWDMKENEGQDAAPGTFAELLRYGSVHFEQRRKEIEYVKAQKPEQVLKKGLFEP